MHTRPPNNKFELDFENVTSCKIAGEGSIYQGYSITWCEALLHTVPNGLGYTGEISHNPDGAFFS